MISLLPLLLSPLVAACRAFQPAGAGRPASGKAMAARLLAGLFAFGAVGAHAQTTTLNYTGSAQTYTVPAGVTQLDVVAIGGAGGSAIFNSSDRQAAGALVRSRVTVIPGEVLTVQVGGNGATPCSGAFCSTLGGYNGGGRGSSGSNNGGGGGGATDVRRNAANGSTGDYLTTRNALLVAAGGAGRLSGYASGGFGGTQTGYNGAYAGNGAVGLGASPTAPGGVAGGVISTAGVNGGGGSGAYAPTTGSRGGGGGGGGYYGGGGGQSCGGGGGSSWVMPTGSTNTQYTLATQFNAPYYLSASVAITPLPPTPVLTTVSPTSGTIGSTVTITGNYFTGVTGVSFNGVAANYTINSETSLTVTVPNSTAGPISVSSGGGTATAAFTINYLAVTVLAPLRNALAAAPGSTVSATFNQAPTAASAAGIRVFSSQFKGRRLSTSGASGNTATLTISGGSFRAGEVVQVSVPNTVQTSAGTRALPHVYQFTAAAAGAGRGNFLLGSEVSTGTRAGKVVIGDVDGDGDLDLVTTNFSVHGGSNVVAVRLNTGNGTFAGGSDVTVGNGPNGLVLGDVDGDGDLDMVTANENGTTCSIRLNNGSGVFSGGSDPAMGNGPIDVALADVDGDGDLDLLAALYNYSNGSNTASVRLNDGAGNFAGGSNPVVVGNPTGLVVGDVDNDGDVDLVTFTFGSSVNVRLNNGSGVFSGGSNLSVNGNVMNAFLGDVDNDGDLDLLAANYNGTVHLRLNDGTGTFGGGTDLTLGTVTNNVVLADVDADGDLDLLANNNNSRTVSLRLNNGSGTFSGTTELPMSTSPNGLATGDVDGDGDLDLLTSYYIGSASHVGVRLNQPPAPTISSFSPNPAGAGLPVTLTGTNLAGATALTINGAAATILSNTATSLTFRVPAGAAASGTSTVTTAGGAASSTAFTFLPAPGNALAFDGTDDYVSVPHNAAFNVTAAITLEAWVRTTATGEKYITTKANDSWYLAVNGGGGAPGVASFFLNGPSTNTGGWLHGTTNLADGRWHHVAGTYDGVALRLYVDGVQQNSRAATGAILTGGSPVSIGMRTGSYNWNGSLDEVRFYNTALTQAQIQADMTSTTATAPANLLAHYSFDQGTPATASTGNNAGLTTLYDQSSNAFPGTLTGFALASGITTSNWVESYAQVVPAVTAASSVTTSGFTTNWTAPAFGVVDSYVLEVSTSSTFASAISGSPFAISAPTTSLSVTGLPPGTQYYYRVRAEKASVMGQGGYSATGQVRTLYTPPGNALALDGAGDYVALPTGLNTANFTFEAWVNYQDNGFWTRIFDFGSSTNTWMMLTPKANYGGATSGNIAFGIASNGGGGIEPKITTTTPMPIGSWHHVAITLATTGGTTSGTLYLDGQVIGTNPSMPVSPAGLGTLTNLWLGRSQYGQDPFLRSQLDEVRLYNAALTQAQIQADMRNTTAAMPANLLAYYDFDQGTAGGSNAGLTNLTDQSSNAFSGTLSGFALTGTTSNWVESYALLQPTGLAASAATNSGLTASWTAPTINGAAPAAGTVDGYKLDVSTSSTFATGVTTLSVSGYGTTSQAVTGLANGTDYYMRVRPIKNSLGDVGTNSAPASTHTIGTDALLIALQPSVSALTPAFTSATLAYTLYLPAGQSTYTLTSTASNAYTTILVNGTPVASGTASGALNVGSTASIVLTSEDQNTTTTYTVQALAAPGYFRSAVATGNWGDAGSWEASEDGSTGWGPAPLAPTGSYVGNVTVRSGHTITVAAITSTRATTIESGGVLNTLAGATLVVPSGATMTVNAGGLLSIGRLSNGTSGSSTNLGTLSLAGSLTVNGTLVLNTGSVSPASQGLSAASVTVNNGGRLIHFATSNGAVLPVATWNTGSTLELGGGTVNQTYNTTSTAATYHNVDINLVNLVASPATATTPFIWSFNATPTINGTLTVVSTGQGSLRLFYATSTGTLTIGAANGSGGYVQQTGTNVIGSFGGTASLSNTVISVRGSFVLDGGTFAALQGSTNAPAALRPNPLSIAGDLVVASGATFNLLGTALPTTFYSVGTVTLLGNVHNAGTLSSGNTANSATKFAFAKAGTQTFTQTGAGTVSGQVSAQVNAGTSLDLGTSIFGGSGTFSTVTSGNTVATLRLGDPDGLATTGALGNVQTTGPRNFAGGTSYVFSGTVPQTLGVNFPVGTLNNTNARLVFDNPAGVTLATAVASNAGTLQLKQGVVTSTAANLLTLGISSGFPGTLEAVAGNTGSVSGPFRRWVAASTGARVFPLSTGGVARPATFDFTTAPSVGGTLTVEFVDELGGNEGLPLTDASSGITVDVAARRGFWRATRGDGLSNDGTYTARLVFTDLPGVLDFTQLVLLKRDDELQPWAAPGTHVATTGTNAAPVLSRSGLTGFSDFTAGGLSSQNPLPVILTAFEVRVAGADAQLRWRTAQELNNDYFAVEVSTDGLVFQPLGRVQGRGSSSTPTDYAFIDRNLSRYGVPLLYYRLRQVDRNGTATLSRVRTVAVPGMGTQLAVYPNPTRVGATLLGAQAGSSVRVYDSLGRIVATATADAAGTALLVLPRDVAPGVYVVRTGTRSLRLVVE